VNQKSRVEAPPLHTADQSCEIERQDFQRLNGSAGQVAAMVHLGIEPVRLLKIVTDGR